MSKIAAVVIASFLCSPLISQANLLDDPGFEGSGTGPWNVSASHSNFNVTCDATDQTHGGSQSACVSWSSPVPQWGLAAIEKDIPVQPGQKWSAEVYATVPVALDHVEAYLETFFYNANGNEIGNLQSSKLSPTTSWTLLVNEGVVPTNAVSARYRLVVFASAGESSSGTIYFDDASAEVNAGASASAGVNLLHNGGFEAVGWDNQKALHWNWNNPDQHSAVWNNATRENWRSHSGSWLGAIGGQWKGSDNGGWWQEVPAQAGVTYTFSAWFWADNSWTNQSDQGLKLEFYSGAQSAGALLSVVVTNVQGIGETWVQKSFSAVAPANATWVRVVVWAGNVGAEGALQFDDLSLVAEPGTVILISDNPPTALPKAMFLIPLAGLCLRKRRKEASRIETI